MSNRRHFVGTRMEEKILRVILIMYALFMIAFIFSFLRMLRNGEMIDDEKDSSINCGHWQETNLINCLIFNY